MRLDLFASAGLYFIFFGYNCTKMHIKYKF